MGEGLLTRGGTYLVEVSVTKYVASTKWSNLETSPLSKCFKSLSDLGYKISSWKYNQST